jgi:hypothetical protein
MLGKIILWISGLVFIAYGLACLISPELPAGYAGLSIVTGDGFAEVGAMYGGLQIGVGVFCVLCALRPTLTSAGLLLLFIGIGCLALARLYSAAAADWMVGAYTWGALAFEFSVTVLSGIALQRSSAAAP